MNQESMDSDAENEEDVVESSSEADKKRRLVRKLVFVSAFGAAVLVFYLIYNRFLTPEKITGAESTLRGWYTQKPVLFLFTAFVIYVVATGLSLPISTILSLSYAWILGWVAVPLLNLAATCGATLAFLSARFLFKDWVQTRFAENLSTINRGFERDGAFFVASMRMVALFPFWIVNLVCGLVPIRTSTYFVATMLGMLPLNFAFVYLGMQIPSTEEFLEQGIKSLISWQLLLGIGLIGLVPLGLRLLVNRMSTKPLDAKEIT